MERHLYFLSVREHIGGEELAAEMAAAAKSQGRPVVVHPRARVEDLRGAPQSAAAIVLFTYADCDLTAANALLKSLPENECGLIPVAAQTPARAPFLQALRERARDMLAPGSPAEFIEIADTAAADKQQLAPALKQLADIIFAQEEESRRKEEKEKAETKAEVKAESEVKPEPEVTTKTEPEQQTAAEPEPEQQEAEEKPETATELDASKPTLLSIAAHLGFALEELWREASQKLPECGLSDPFSTPPQQLRREITALLRKDFEQHKNDRTLSPQSVRNPRNPRYDIIVFAFVILCHRLHEDEESEEQVLYDELHLFDRGNESPLFPLFTLCWIFAAEDMIAHGKTNDAMVRLENIMISFRKKKTETKTGAAAKKGGAGNAKVPPLLRVMALRALFFVSAKPEKQKQIGEDLQKATDALSEEDRQIINARARFFAAVNKAHEEIKDLL